MSDELERKSTPWLTTRFDWEGVAAALAAWLIGLLLGWLWSPFFWLGVIGVVAALLAARWQRRTAPDLASGVVAPCDGLVVSVSKAEPPAELGLSQQVMTRIRISSSPATTNRLYAPIAGSIERLATSEGDNSVPLAMRPDDTGLSRAALVLQSRGQSIGVLLASGGLGPRLELEIEAGDICRLGREIGKRRLGGWCDVYLPVTTGQLIWEGQSLVGGETVLGRLRSEEEAGEPVMAAEEAAVGGDESYDYDPAVEEAESEEDDYPDPSEAVSDEDPAVILARLKEASKDHLGD